MLLPTRFIQSHREDMNKFASGITNARLMGSRREIAGRRKNGEEFPAEASISKRTINGTVVFHVILRDVSARKQAVLATRALIVANAKPPKCQCQPQRAKPHQWR